MLKHDLCI